MSAKGGDGFFASLKDSIIDTFFNLDFPRKAFERTCNSKSIQFSAEDISTRKRILETMLEASSKREKEVVEVCLNTVEAALVQQEYSETIAQSCAILLLEHFNCARELNPKELVEGAISHHDQPSSKLKRADTLIFNGPIPYYKHVKSITAGFDIVMKPGFSQVILLPCETKEAGIQREEIKKRAASKKVTYYIRVEHESDLGQEAMAAQREAIECSDIQTKEEGK